MPAVTLYFASSSTAADPTLSSAWKNAATEATATVSSGDTIIFDYRGTGNLAPTNVTNLNMASTLPAAIIIDQSFTGEIGNGTNYWQIGATLGTVGSRSGSSSSPSGSPRIMIDEGTTACTWSVIDSASTSTDTYRPPVQLKGTALTVNQSGGNVGIAARQPEASTAIVNMVAGSGVTISTPQLFVGANATLSQLTANAGVITCRSDNTVATLTLSGSASCEHLGAGAITTATLGAGSYLYHSGSGAITTLNNSGTYNRERDTRPVTITNTNLYAGSSFLADNGLPSSITRTNVTIVNCAVQDIAEIRLPIGEKL